MGALSGINGKEGRSERKERGTEEDEDLRGSIGWAASPMRTRRERCHVGRGLRERRGQSLMSLALLVGVRRWRREIWKDVNRRPTCMPLRDGGESH